MEKLLKNLEKRNFEGYFFETKEDAVKKILELIPSEASVSWGGSVTIDELGVKDKLRERKNPLFDRALGKTTEEAEEIMRQGLLADFFLMSSNAITEEGILFNIDGRANRVASLCYGPRNVIVVVGKNKIVKDLNEAYERVKTIAAPTNGKRLNLKTPCTIDKCLNCLSPECMCSQIVTTRMTKPKGRIKVIIINEELGF